MNDGPIEATTRTQQTKDSHLGSLATQVVSTLAVKRAALLNAGTENWIRHLTKAALHSDPHRTTSCIEDMIETGIPADVIIDTLIPEAARRLGAEWVNDRLSFVEVTIGSARLQSALRHSTLMPAHDVAFEGHAIVLTPEEETHTLGALTLAAQLRRCRMSVEIHLGPSRTELKSIGRLPADFIAVSCTTDHSLSGIGPTIDALRYNAGPDVRLAVGGPAVTRQSISVLTDVDLVSNDLKTLMRLRRTKATVAAGATG